MNKTADKTVEDEIINQALAIMASRVKQRPYSIDSPNDASTYLRLKLSSLEHEVFGVLWLTPQMKLIEDSQLFRGTLNQTPVFPREVAKQGLLLNAQSCVVYHNHPSGSSDPSDQDENLTKILKDTLASVDINLLDHLVVAHESVYSFAQHLRI